jgi:hypothetical protein
MHIQRGTQYKINPTKSTTNSNNGTMNITDTENIYNEITQLENEKHQNNNNLPLWTFFERAKPSGNYNKNWLYKLISNEWYSRTYIRKTVLKHGNRKHVPNIKTNTKQSKHPNHIPGTGHSYTKTEESAGTLQTPQWLAMKHTKQVGEFFIRNVFLEHYGVDKDKKPSNPRSNILKNSMELSQSWTTKRSSASHITHDITEKI